MIGGQCEVSIDPAGRAFQNFKGLAVDDLDSVSFVFKLVQFLKPIFDIEEEFHFEARFSEVGPVVAR